MARANGPNYISQTRQCVRLANLPRSPGSRSLQRSRARHQRVGAWVVAVAAVVLRGCIVHAAILPRPRSSRGGNYTHAWRRWTSG